jgi:hypothetical protein
LSPTIGLAIWLNAQLQNGFRHGSLIWIHNFFCHGDLVVLSVCVDIKSKVKQYTFAFSFYKRVRGAHFEWIPDPQVWHPFLLLLGIKSVNSTTCWNQLHWLRSIHIVLLFTKMTWQKKVTCGKDITCSTKRVTYCGIFYGIEMGMVSGGFWTNVVWILYLNVGVNFQNIYVSGQGILASKLFQTWSV